MEKNHSFCISCMGNSWIFIFCIFFYICKCYSFILANKPRMLNISIDSPSLNVLSLLLSDLPQKVERINVLLVIYETHVFWILYTSLYNFYLQ